MFEDSVQLQVDAGTISDLEVSKVSLDPAEGGQNSPTWEYWVIVGMVVLAYANAVHSLLLG